MSRPLAWLALVSFVLVATTVLAATSTVVLSVEGMT